MKNSLSVFITAILILASPFASAQLSPLQEKVKATMALDHRDETDTARDRNRDPINALEFFGLKLNMKVIEFIPGNGWYTKILAPVLRDQGELHVASKNEWLDRLDGIFSLDAINKAKKLPIEVDWNNVERRYEFGRLNFGMTDADMVLNIREYHNFDLENKAKLNKAAYDSLKPGGTYVIVDHSRRPNGTGDTGTGPS